MGEIALWRSFELCLLRAKSTRSEGPGRLGKINNFNNFRANAEVGGWDCGL